MTLTFVDCSYSNTHEDIAYNNKVRRPIGISDEKAWLDGLNEADAEVNDDVDNGATRI